MRSEAEIKKRYNKIADEASNERAWDDGICHADRMILKEEEVLAWVLNEPTTNTKDTEIRRLKREIKQLHKKLKQKNVEKDIV